MSFVCEQCGYSTEIKCNLTRHIKTCKNSVRNSEKKVRNSEKKVRNSEKKVRNSEKRVRNSESLNPTFQQNYEKVSNRWQCSICKKSLSKSARFTHTSDACVRFKVGLCVCKWCGKIHKTANSRLYHEKKCCSKKEPICEESQCTTINYDNRVTNNNIDNSTIHNTSIVNNNITIQLNVHGRENYDVLLNTIRTKYPQAFVTMVEEGDTASLLKLVHFNNDFPENQTIRKPIKKDVSAEVHMGEGRWEKRPTQDVIEDFRGHTSKRLCDLLDANVTTFDKQNDMYLKEILYEQSKTPSGNTDSLLQRFIMSGQDLAAKGLMEKVIAIKCKLLKEYPSLIGTKLFVNQWKRESRPLIHAFENRWNTVIDNMYWTNM